MNFILNNLMTEVALHKQTETKDSAIVCEKCVSGDPALVRCGLCGIFLCDFCSQAHRRDKITYSHKLVTIDKLKSVGPSARSKPDQHGLNPKKTTLQMEAGKAGVFYNTLVNQTRDFVVVTRNSKGEQIREDGTLINVEIKEPNNLNPKVVPVQDCGHGRYTFNYKPVCVGNYQVSVKVNGGDIRGSPFTWVVEQWHLVARYREYSELIFSQGHMTVERRWWGCRLGDATEGSCGFTDGCHSWKVKIVSGGGWCSVGVTDCNVKPGQQQNTWYCFSGSKYHVCNGTHTGKTEPSNIPVIHPNDVIIVYLDNDMTLNVHHLPSNETDTFTLQNTTLYPYFYLGWQDKLTLLF